MEFSKAEIVESIRRFWGKLTKPQKVITVVAPLVVAVALITLIVWASRPEYVTLFTDLNESDAGAVTEKLKDLKVGYRLENNGTTILVPKSEAAEIRLQLAKEGLPQGSKFSFDYLNQMRIGETESDRRVRYILGLQTELETTLKTLDGVDDVRVHIVMPEESLFAENQQEATAAVTIKRRPERQLSENQVAAIANLMAASVEGLKPENVTIVDTEGNIYEPVPQKAGQVPKLTTTQIEYQALVEQNIEKSIQTMLDRVFGYGTTVVRVRADLDFDEIKIIEQTNGPGALVSRQVTQESSTGTTPGGVPGTDTNVPGYPAYTGGTTTSESSSTTENYQVDTRQEERIVSPGAIKRLSVSVIVNSEKISEGLVGDFELNNRLEQIQLAVASAAGIDENRGDQIQVAALPFHKIGMDEEEPQHPLLDNPYFLYGALGAALLVLIVAVILILRARALRRRAAAEEGVIELDPTALAKAEELMLAQQKAEEEAMLRLAQKQAKTAEEIEKQKIKEAIEQYSKNNPDEVARLIRSWIAEER